MIAFTVEDMSCGHCAAAITKALTAVDAQATVEVDLPGKEVRVESAAPAETLKLAIQDAGYAPVQKR